VKLCTKNYENPSAFVKVTAKKSVAAFFLDTVYITKKWSYFSNWVIVQFRDMDTTRVRIIVLLKQYARSDRHNMCSVKLFYRRYRVGSKLYRRLCTCTR